MSWTEEEEEGFGVLCEAAFCVVEVEIEGAGVDVDEDRGQPEDAHGQDGGEEGIAGDEDLAAGREVEAFDLSPWLDVVTDSLHDREYGRCVHRSVSRCHLRCNAPVFL